MKTEMAIQIRAFPVTIRDLRTGEETEDTVVLTKEQLQACQIVGQSSKELIFRLCNRQGVKVLSIGSPIKRTIKLNLEELYKLYCREVRDVAE